MSNERSVKERSSEFARNAKLESLLGDVNNDMALAETQAMARYRGLQPELPPVFVMGAPRSGTTLFMQWLASTGVFAYPSNMLSRFWEAPIIGARIQKLLTDPAYDFRDELHDFKGGTGFDSHHGKTTGALSPNEFWYFWRRFLPGNDYQPREQLERAVDVETLRAELAGITDVLGKPFAAKGMIFNENIPFIADRFPNAIFIWIRRQPEYNIQSLLLARERQYGDMKQWYSFRIREYLALVDLPPLASVSGQVASIHRSIEAGLESLPADRSLVVDYDAFCQRPGQVYVELADRLLRLGHGIPEYSGPASFTARNEWRLNWVTKEGVEAANQRAKAAHVR